MNERERHVGASVDHRRRPFPGTVGPALGNRGGGGGDLFLFLPMSVLKGTECAANHK